jgi:hypothetical protein
MENEPSCTELSIGFVGSLEESGCSGEDIYIYPWSSFFSVNLLTSFRKPHVAWTSIAVQGEVLYYYGKEVKLPLCLICQEGIIPPFLTSSLDDGGEWSASGLDPYTPRGKSLPVPTG